MPYIKVIEADREVWYKAESVYHNTTTNAVTIIEDRGILLFHSSVLREIMLQNRNQLQSLLNMVVAAGTGARATTLFVRDARPEVQALGALAGVWATIQASRISIDEGYYNISGLSPNDLKSGRIPKKPFISGTFYINNSNHYLP
jgi:hypothetical protein